MPSSTRDPVPNVMLYNLRDARSQTQEQTAAALNALAAQRGQTTAITGNQVSRWERGVVHPSRLHAQLLAEHFGVTVVELGLIRQRPVPSTHSAYLVGDTGSLLTIEDPEAEGSGPVSESQNEWLHVRSHLHTHHRALAKAAAQLYPRDQRVGDTGILAKPDWTLTTPLDLADIEIHFEPGTPPPVIDGTGESTREVRPLRATGGRYSRYSHAIRDVAKPTLFENRTCWRLVDAKFSETKGLLEFGSMTYFEAMDTCEAIAHETALTHLSGNTVASPSWRGLRFRKAIGDPFDLSRRAVVLSINTLTLRRDKRSVSVILHNRNAANVATSGGIIGVMPAGVFQPSTTRPGEHMQDFDLWRNIMREYSEEFLGNAEHDGDDVAANYSEEPFRSLDAARTSRAARLYCFGLGVGALDLWCGLETAAVFDADAFDDLFVHMVRVNQEGTVVRIGQGQPTVHIPFTRPVIDDLLTAQRLAPETALSLEYAWRHRDMLLA